MLWLLSVMNRLKSLRLVAYSKSFNGSLMFTIILRDN